MSFEMERIERLARLFGMSVDQYTEMTGVELPQARGLIQEPTEPAQRQPTMTELWQTMTPAHRRVLQMGMKAGIPREQFLQEIRGLTPVQAEEYLRTEYLTGYEQARQAFQRGTPEEREAGFVSEAMWQYYPEHLRLRRTRALPVSELPKDPQGQPIIPPGYIRRQQEAHVFPTEVLTRGSHLALLGGGETVTTWDPSKWEKRIQMLGAHEMVRMTGLESIRAEMPSGPLSMRGEQLQKMRGAYIVGGDIGGPGAALVSPEIGPAAQRLYREVLPSEEHPEFPWVARRGATWGPGEQMVLAGGLTGERTGKWRYQVTDVAPLEGGGYGFTLERSADIEQARIYAKMGATKLMGDVADISGITTPEGERLNLQFVGGLKDIQGAVYQHFMAQGRGYLAQQLGMAPEELPRSYAELGRAPMEAFASRILPQLMQTIHVPQTLTTEAMQRYRESGALVGEPEQVRPGIWRGVLAQQALVGEWATQFGHMYPVKRPFLSYEELEHVQRQQPQLYERLMRSSVEERHGYRELLQASIANLGVTKPPPGTLGAEQFNLPGLFAAATARAQAETGLQEPAPGVLRAAFMRQLAESEQGAAPIALETPIGSVYLPSGQTMQRFGARGKYAGEEQSRYLIAAERLLAHAAAGGTGEEFTQSAMQFMQRQEELARSGEFVRRATGARIPGAIGDVLHTSQALRPWEAYVPGMEGQAIQPVGFPSRGGAMWGQGMQVVGIGREEAVERGIDPSQMTFSMDLIQALARDVDGDLALAIPMGRVVVQEDGTITDSKGVRLNSSTEILEQAKKAREEGAGNVWDEMAGATAKRTLSREEALDQVQRSIAGASVGTTAEVETQVRAGAELRGRIGPHYNVFRGPAGTIPEHSREAFERLFQISHGRAQRPAPQLPGMAEFHKLARAALWKPPTEEEAYQGSIGRLTRGAYSPEAGGPGLVSRVPGVAGLREAATRTLLGLRGERGEQLLTGEQFGALMGTPERQGRLEQLYERYQAARTPGEKAETMQELVGALGPTGEWVTQTAMGHTIGAPAVARAAERGVPSAGTIGLTEESYTQALEIRRQQLSRIAAFRRTRAEGASELIERVRAAAEVVPSLRGIAGLTAERGAPAAAAELPAGSFQGPVAAPPEPEVPSAPMPAPAGGGVGLPPEPPVATAAPAMPEEEPSETFWRSMGVLPPGQRGAPQRGAPAAQEAAPAEEGAAARLGAILSGARQPTRGQPTAAPAARAGEVPLQPGTKFTVTQAGTLMMMEQRVTGRHVEELKQINDYLKQWGAKLRPLVESTGELDSKQQSVLRDVDAMQKRIGIISSIAAGGLGAPQTVTRVQDLLAQLDPQRDWMEQARQRILGVRAGQALGGFGDDGDGDGGITLGQRAMGLGRRLTSGWGMMWLSRVWGMTGGRLQPWMGAAAQEEMATYQAAMAAGAPVAAPGGFAGTMIHQQQMAALNQAALGRQAFTAWTPPAQLGAWGAGPLGAAAAIGLPAIGVGAGAGYLAGAAGLGAAALPLGLAAGGIVAGIGGLNYAYGAATDVTGRAVGRAGWESMYQGEGWRGTEFRQALGAALADVGGVIEGLLPGGKTSEEILAENQQELELGRRMMAGETQGLSAAQTSEAIRLRAAQLSKQRDIMGVQEYSTLMGQMMRYTGRELGGVSDEEIAQMAALTRAVGAAPGELPQQLGAVAQQWGIRRGTEEMSAFQAMMAQAPTVQDFERQMGVYQQYAPMFRWGVGIEQVGGAPTLSPMQESRMQQMAGGNRYLWSMYGRAMGRPELETMEAGGLPIFTTGLGQWAPEALGLQTQAAAGGLWGVQDAMTQLQRDYRDRGVGRQWEQLQWSAQMQWGGPGYTAMAPAPTSVMGLQDQMTAQAYQSQMGQFAYQQQMFDLRNRQFMEDLGLRREIFETRVGWQQEDLPQQRERAETRFGWSMQDWAYTENVAQLRFGWGMEDFDEQIKMSTGRDRQRLQRERERTVIMESMRREHHEDQKERLEEQREWQEEDFEKSKERNERLIELQRRQFDQSKRHHEETTQLQQAQMGRTRADYEERHRLQTQLQQLQRQNAMQQHEWQKQALRDQMALNQQMDVLQDDYRDLQRAQSSLIADWQRIVLYSEEVAANIVDILGVISAPSGSPYGGTTTPSTPSLPSGGSSPTPPGYEGFTQGAAASASTTPTVHISVTATQLAQELAEAIALTLDEYDVSFAN